MKKVLHIISSWGTGGVERYIYNYSKYLKEYSFDVLTLRKSTNSSVFDSQQINIYHLKEIHGNFFTRLEKRKKLIIEFLENNKYDIIHFDMTTADAFILAKAIKRKFPVKIVMHCHATNVEPPNIYLKKMLHYFSKVFYSKYADYYIGASEDTMKWMYTKKIRDGNQCSVITCGIEVDKFKFDEDKRKEIRTKYNINKKFVIGTVGRFSTQKNLPFIIDIIEKYSKINNDFVFLWAGNGNLMNYVKNELNKRSLEKYVLFLGVCSNIEEIYSAMDLFILPSLYEANPIVAMEAQANGLMCFLSKNITYTSKLSDNVKFIDIKDSNQWVKEIEIASKNCIHRYEHGKINMSLISAKENAEKLENVYMKLDKEV